MPMPKRKTPAPTAAEQAAQFERAAQAMINAGELDPIAAGEALERVVRKGAKGNFKP